jgi:hypothetical protein
MGETCGVLGRDKILIRKSEMKKPFGRPRRRWKDNIRKDIRERVWEVVEWIRLD